MFDPSADTAVRALRRWGAAIASSSALVGLAMLATPMARAAGADAPIDPLPTMGPLRSASDFQAVDLTDSALPQTETASAAPWREDDNACVADGLALPASQCRHPDAHTPRTEWHALTVHRGDTLSALFHRLDLPAASLAHVMQLGGHTKALRRLHPGDRLRLRTTSDHRLDTLRYSLGPIRTLVVQRDDDSLSAHIEKAPVDHRLALASGRIHHSLYRAATRAGLASRQIAQLARIFRWHINFSRELRPGDRFRVVYRQPFVGDHPLQPGRIVAVRLQVDGKTHRAFWFQPDDGHGGAYYDARGRNLAQGILRAPLHYKYISSGFSYHRLNPVTHVVEPHYGVDYAARIGTPVHAAANGRVHCAHRVRGYGRLVVINSFGHYQTYYAHLHRYAKGLHEGEWVHQGQLIGYVGESGETTGPHLHFGIRKDRRWVNPRTASIPSGPPVPHNRLAAFHQHIQPLLADLRTEPGQLRLAGREPNGTYTDGATTE